MRKRWKLFYNIKTSRLLAVSVDFFMHKSKITQDSELKPEDWHHNDPYFIFMTPLGLFANQLSR